MNKKLDKNFMICMNLLNCFLILGVIILCVSCTFKGESFYIDSSFVKESHEENFIPDELNYNFYEISLY